LFVTHLHSDHVVGIPDLWLTGWLFGRELPLRVWGPSGTEAMMGHLAQAYRADIKIRRADEQLPELGAEIVVHDFTEGLIYESDGLKVTPFDVDHGDLIKPALGYRIEYRGRCVVLSGDTRPCENLVRFARQCDVLVHEVAAAPLETLEGEPGSSSSFSADRLRRILGHHTTPEQAGDIFRRVEPRLAVYSHIVLFDTITVDDLLSRTRTTYTGPLRVGEDLMVIDVGSAITLHSPP